jgi:hypothetical protein
MYYQKIALGIAACALVSAVSSAAHRWTTEAREAIQHVFNKDKALEVDNINGTIEVVGDNGTTIRVTGERVIRAEDQTELERAKREVTLDMNEKDGVAQLYVNGPFRNHDHASDDHGFHEHSDRHYEVTYNITVRVPHLTDLRLRNVNGGIKAGETTGKFDVNGVNGSVTMNSIGGSGTVRTVNGEMILSFNENPKLSSDFKTVNGRIEATFAPNLSADVRLRTFNGGAFTDFDGTALAAQPATIEKRNGRSVFRANRASNLRIGAGGPELSFETVNGSISIKKGTGK